MRARYALPTRVTYARRCAVLRVRYRRVYQGANVLLIKPLWSGRIFDVRDKRVEIRGEPTRKRGTVFVVESGSYFITGPVPI